MKNIFDTKIAPEWGGLVRWSGYDVSMNGDDDDNNNNNNIDNNKNNNNNNKNRFESNTFIN